jgi:ubiquinone/menaquinone biosynthesis C-methylase UbiE
VDERELRRLRRIRRSYDGSASRYDAFMEHGLSGRLFGRGRRGVGEAVRGRVLEVGIGSGLVIPHYASEVEIFGIDLSLGMLGHALRRARRGGREIALFQMDAQRLAFADESFDSVAFTLCLCTIPDPRRAIREGLRVARPGASLVFLEHVRSDLWPVAIIQDVISPLTVLMGEDSFNRRTLDDVRAAGVEVESVERWALGSVTLIKGRKPLS